MDGCIVEPLGAVVLGKSAKVGDTRRPPLAHSGKNNAVPASRKPQTREIASRYKSGISSSPISNSSTPRRCRSPSASRTPPAVGMSLPKRAQSAERRPSTPSPRFSAPLSPSSRPSTPSSLRSSAPFSPSSRPSTPYSSLRFSAPLSPSSRPSTPSSSRSSAPLSTSSRPSTPSRSAARNAVAEKNSTCRQLITSRAPDGLWPSMRSLSSSFQSESMLIPIRKKEKIITSSSSDQSKSQFNTISERKRTPLRGRNTADLSENSRLLESPHARMIEQRPRLAMMGRKVSANAMSRSMDLTDKVNRSVCLPVPSRGLSPRRMPTSDGVGRDHQQSLHEVASCLNLDGSGRADQRMSPSPYVSSQIFIKSTSLTRPSRTLSLPVPGLQRPSSPSKTLSTTSSVSRRIQSPSRARPSTPVRSTSAGTSRADASPSVHSHIFDARKGRRDAKQVEDAHQLRLLCNRDMQWHFLNALADETLSTQKMRSEGILHNMWSTISRLRDSVLMKRIDVQHFRQEVKLNTILKEQIDYLQRWATLEREHSSSLSGAIESLKASILRLPVTGGAMVDMLDLKNAVSSAVDIMQAMGSSICYLLSKVLGTYSLVADLSVVAAKERAMLDECRELFLTIAALQVQESSLRTNLIQLRQESVNIARSHAGLDIPNARV
ncbi:AUGMIN subunit 8-like [Typha latifolia]|uniref:AUGMIN subunit 8-like n=1 Tax=Typha latifolia TaxID=4733 RepID=UPI003C2C8A9D